MTNSSERIPTGAALDRATLLRWLQEEDESVLEALWASADAVRRESVGDEVHLRGLIELSNHCVRRCAYCGIRSPNAKVVRYRMTMDEILACARRAAELDYGTVVLQAGEDLEHDAVFVAELVRRIKGETGRAVTLSLGERPLEDYRLWKKAGADRYLLRFETTDAGLFARIHPGLPGREPRLTILRKLRELGYQTGSGVMLGIPGQRWGSLATDLELFRELDLDMIGVGPFIPHPDTPLGRGDHRRFPPAPVGEQVPATQAVAYRVLALTRLLRPDAHIPSTTAIASLDPRGRELGLQRGANVVMPNLTPLEYRRLYEIYPAKACLAEEPGVFHSCLLETIEAIGRRPGEGPGHRERSLP